MKAELGSIRIIILALVASFGGMTAARAQGTCPASPAYSPDFSQRQNCLALNGSNTSFTGSPSFSSPQTPQQAVSTVLRLTANQGGWATSAWYSTAQPVTNGFSTTFSFQIGNSTSGGVNQ